MHTKKHKPNIWPNNFPNLRCRCAISDVDFPSLRPLRIHSVHTHTHTHTDTDTHAHVIHLYKCLADNLSRALPFADKQMYICIANPARALGVAVVYFLAPPTLGNSSKLPSPLLLPLPLPFWPVCLVYFSGYFSHCYQIEWKHILIERKFTSNLVRERHPRLPHSGLSPQTGFDLPGLAGNVASSAAATSLWIYQSMLEN